MIPSLPKLLGLIAIIWVVWTGFRMFEARQAALRAQDGKNAKDGAESDQASGGARSGDDASVDLRECKICSAWVSGENCGRENCPY